jgi:hypothetical protein
VEYPETTRASASIYSHIDHQFDFTSRNLSAVIGSGRLL